MSASHPKSDLRTGEADPQSGLAANDPLRTLSYSYKLRLMLWWDWDARQRIGLFAAMLGIAATPCILLGWATPAHWRAFVGGTAFLLGPQILAWVLFVGLRTGRMPTAYGGSELRNERPIWYWLMGAVYGAVVLLFLGFILYVITDGMVHGW